MNKNHQGYVLKFLSDETIDLRRETKPRLIDYKETNNNFLCLLDKLSKGLEEREIDRKIAETGDFIKKIIDNLGNFPKAKTDSVDNSSQASVSSKISTRISTRSTRISTRLSKVAIIKPSKKNKTIDPSVIQSYIQELSRSESTVGEKLVNKIEELYELSKIEPIIAEKLLNKIQELYELSKIEPIITEKHLSKVKELYELRKGELIITEERLRSIIDALTSILTIYSESTKKLKEHQKNLKKIKNNPPDVGWKIWEKGQKIQEWEKQKQVELEHINELHTEITEQRKNLSCLNDGIIKLLDKNMLPPATEENLYDIMKVLISQLRIYAQLATQLKEHEKNLKEIENNPPDVGWKISEKGQKIQEWEKQKQVELEHINKLNDDMNKRRKDSLCLGDYIIVKAFESTIEEEEKEKSKSSNQENLAAATSSCADTITEAIPSELDEDDVNERARAIIQAQQATNLKLNQENLAAAARVADVVMKEQQQALENLEKKEATKRAGLYEIEDNTREAIELNSAKSFELANLHSQLRIEKEKEELKYTLDQQKKSRDKFVISEGQQRLAISEDEESERNFIDDKHKLLSKEINQRTNLASEEHCARNIIITKNQQYLIIAAATERERKTIEESKKAKQEEERRLLLLKQEQEKTRQLKEENDRLRKAAEEERKRKADEEEKKREAEQQQLAIARFKAGWR